jgi:hypothetical protein
MKLHAHQPTVISDNMPHQNGRTVADAAILTDLLRPHT